MRVASLLTAAAAVAAALTLFDASPIEAAPRQGFSARKAPPVRRAQPRVAPRSPKVLKATPKITKTPKVLKTTPKVTTKVPKTLKATPQITKTPLTKGSPSAFMQKVPPRPLNLKTLPLHKAAAGNKLMAGKLTVPKNIKPKLTLAIPPKPIFHKKFSPFIQRHWKHAFFWVAVAGIGYLTVPSLYYDTFYTCVNGDDPIYDDCIDILSYAALEEEEVVRVSMPAGAAYKYRAKAPIAAKPQDCPSCRWDRFVERKWNQSFSWVKIPEIGNVTVPDGHYDRFYGFAGANPPNYPQACQVLQEAASTKEEGEVVHMSMPAGTDYRFEAGGTPTSACKSCTMEPFVDRKWNREFVWVQVPEAGNVTVPEDYYDRFYSYASAEPPNYGAACRVLVEAAAADTVMTTALDNRRGLEQ
jgi:hypothetical protein